jgi:branched-chain amino acid transport system substrate-binding protein
VSRTRVFVSLLAVAVGLVAVAAAQSKPKAGKTINIGWVGDRSGPIVVSISPQLHGMQAYFQYLNDHGGVNGDKVNLIVKDDGYSPSKALELVKSLISDDKVSLITELSSSSAIGSIIPILNAAKVPGYEVPSTQKTSSWPFQPWMFEGNCNLSDQADVALAYEMKRLKLKTLANKTVGVAGLAGPAGDEWLQVIKDESKFVGSPKIVNVTIPVAVVNADVQVQSLQDAKVDMVLIHGGAQHGIAVLKSMAKYQMTNTPTSGSYGVTNEVLWRSVPYEVARNFVGTNCYTPPSFAKTAVGKLALTAGKKYGYPDSETSQTFYSLGWVSGMVIAQGLKNAKGDYSPAAVRRGLEHVTNLDSGLAPKISLDAKCHMALRQARPYTYSYKKDSIIPIGSFDQWAKYIRNGYAAPGTCGRKP